jgi:hypothetical protein
MFIGSLNRGDIPAAAYEFAREALGALVAANTEAPALAAMNSADREKIFSDLGRISPRKFRLGNGREEADEAVSFLVRFIGREKGITGELYVRRALASDGETEETVQNRNGEAGWRIDDLILEEERGLDEVVEGPSFDLPPYERFF